MKIMPSKWKALVLFLLVGLSAVIVLDKHAVTYMMYVWSRAFDVKTLHIGQYDVTLPDSWWLISNVNGRLTLGKLSDRDAGKANIFVYIESMPLEKQLSRIKSDVTKIGEREVAKVSSVQDSGDRVIRDEYKVISKGPEYGRRYVSYYFLDGGMTVSAADIDERDIDGISELVSIINRAANERSGK